MTRYLICTLLVVGTMMGYAQKPQLVVPIGHTNHVFSVALSSDGRYALSGSYDKTVKLWEVETGREVRTFTGHADQVVSVALSPDGRYALSGSWDNTIKLWDIASGQEIRTFRERSSIVRSVAFSPDGRYILSGSKDKTLKLWEVQSGRKVRTFKGHTDQVYSVAFSPDGNYVLSGSLDKTLKFWNLKTGRAVRTFTGHTDHVYSVAFSPDGRYALSGASDNTLKLWDIQTGQEIRTFRGHSSIVRSVTFSPDGHYALSGSWDNTLGLWDIESGQQLRALRGHIDHVESVAFSPDGRHALSGSSDNTLRLWDVPMRRQVRIFRGHTNMVESVVFSPDGQFLLMGDAKGGAYSRQSNERDNTLKLWDVQTGQFLRTFTGHTNAVHSVAISSDGRYALSGSYDETVKLWEVETGRDVRTLTGHTAQVYSAAISPDGRYALSGASDNTLKLWDIQTGQPVHSFTGHTNGVRTVTISSDGRYALSGSHDKSVKLWDMQTRQEVRTFTGHTNMVISVAFSPDSRYVLSGSADNTLKLWDTQTGQPVRTFKGHTGMVKSVAFSPDSRYLLSGSADNTLKLWDTQTGQPVRTFRGHTDQVETVAFSPDSRFIVSGSWDTTTKLWNIATGDEIATLIAVDYTDWVVTTPTGLFDASPVAMKLLHYVVNDSTDHQEPWKIVELDQLKRRYYQPGLLPILMGYSKNPLREVDTLIQVPLPPTIRLSLQGSLLHVQLQNRNGGIGKVSVFIEGVEAVNDLRTTSSPKPHPQTLSLTLDLSRFQNRLDTANVISVIANNGENWIRSRPERVVYRPTVLSKGVVASETANNTSHPTPRLMAVVAGTSNVGLRYAHKDAEQIANGLRLSAGELLGAANVSISLLTSYTNGPQQTSRQQLIEALKAAQTLSLDDIFVLYLSGHGVNYRNPDQTEPDLYYLTAGATSTDSEYLNDRFTREHYTLSSGEIADYLNQIPAKKKVVILDVCAAGRGAEKILTMARDVPASQKRALDDLYERTNMYVLAGSAADAVSYEASVYGQGLLTYALLQGMRGASLRQEGVDKFLDVEGWLGHAVKVVPQLARGLGGIQKPFFRPKNLDNSVNRGKVSATFDVGKVTPAVQGQIQLANPKPVLVVEGFLDNARLRDVLDLSNQVRTALIDLSARGADAPVAYVEAKDYPGAYVISGLYTVQGDGITVKGVVSQGEKEVVFAASGSKANLLALAEQILTRAQAVVKP
ncbi:cytochrome D1 domain-containing protein [Spirosoma sp. 209]|uniref:cytochrome D1 domain-containing protein n=1 Tax=Spirosoma sp. 209 TaxID=1955701 RepID=UPI00098D0625|nr:cytochrome D1 domain-containing protein [Spirosoma sp. 209]